MSYDFSVRIPAGNKDAYVGDMNYTYNVSGMFRKALGCSVRDLEKKQLGEHRDRLRKACADMAAHPEDYEAMNPPNGWGDAEGAAHVLRTILQWSIDYPNGYLAIH